MFWDRVATGYILLPSEVSSTGIGLHLFELLLKGIPSKSPNNPGYYLEYRLLSTNWEQSSITEGNTYTTHCALRCWTSAYIESSLSWFSVFVTRKKLCTLPKEKCKHQESYKPFGLVLSCLQDFARTIVAQVFWE